MPERHDRLYHILTHVFEDVMSWHEGDEIILSDQSEYPIITDIIEHFPIVKEIGNWDEKIDFDYSDLFDVYAYEYEPIFNRSEALNRGIALASNPYIVTTDIDIIFPANFREEVQSIIEPNTFMVFDTYEMGKQIHSGIPGFCTVFDRELCLKIGGWDENFVGYGHEDNDFRDRMITGGANFIHLPLPIEHIPHPPVKDKDHYGALNYKLYIDKKKERNEKLTPAEVEFLRNKEGK
jgi:hypothetical protein